MSTLLNASNLLPHGYCINWSPSLLWFYVVSDATIVLAYYSIPFTLTYIAWRRKDLKFRGIYLLFSAFILSCGTTHLLGIVVLWNPIYWIDASMKGLTAALSAVTAITLVYITPQVLKLPSPSQYHKEVQGRLLAYEALKAAQATLIEVNEYKKSEEALHASEQRLQLVLKASQLGFWDWDIKNNIVTRNERCAEMLGYQSSDIELTVKQWVDFIHPEDREMVWQSVRDNIDGVKKIHALEYRMRTKNGEYRWVLDQGQVVSWDADQRATRMCGTHTDITERKNMEEQVRNFAFYDALTQLPNRRLLDDRLTKAIATSKRSGYYGAVMFLDLDNFKPINDNHGHQAGDLLLIEVANRVKGCIREVDTVARLGGDEFVVILSELSLDEAESISETKLIAEKILNVLAEPYLLTVTQFGQKDKVIEHGCTASIGAVVFVKDSSSQIDLMKWADAAMYKAKDEGRNLIRFHEDSVTL
ncbi:MAG: sensor domain-containing diguanylate cyclase [Methylotenera sp.]|uniref:sensor domain-containing diguanylate cyclase n=1 Tax=Methylotenera sp. TaxID=2051956 RepID=UPI002489260C|nr:sensor domain-containing diguanylate cyclase [Methylotenera sp.]MDI1308811.1 sensor domain-containing diguanylate cyclase [Methylotenera sp.]